jgi:hypothetical protein
LPPFFLEKFLEKSKSATDVLHNYEKMANTYGSQKTKDRDLLAPLRLWLKFTELGGSMGDAAKRDLDKLTNHAKDILTQFKNISRPSPNPQISLSRRIKHDDRSEDHAPIVRRFSQTPVLETLDKLPGADLNQIKTSCAYDCAEVDSSFPFSVAFSALCQIKAEAHKPAHVTRMFQNAMTIQPSIIRGLKKIQKTRV